MACNKSFSSNYMLLEPNDVGFFDLIHILFSNDLEKRKFVDSSDDKEDEFQRRWLIFLSIVVQKLLQFVAKPMAVIGWGIEMFLNLLSSNGCSLRELLLNLLRDCLILETRKLKTFNTKPISTKVNYNKQEDSHPDLAYYAIRDMLNKLLSQNDHAGFLLTGHSLGGALAILFPAVLALHNETWLLERLQGVYTFGQPRVGDEKFGEFMEKQLQEHNVRYFRFVYGNDMVPRLPYDDKALMFKHFGTCLYSNRHYEVKVVEHEPNKNYFSPLGAIPMIINAFFELIRSFTIAKTKGPDYKEGIFLRIFRIIGLVFPGVPAHSTQDYVNATRLGSSDVFLPPKHISHEHV